MPETVLDAQFALINPMKQVLLVLPSLIDTRLNL